MKVHVSVHRQSILGYVQEWRRELISRSPLKLFFEYHFPHENCYCRHVVFPGPP